MTSFNELNLIGPSVTEEMYMAILLVLFINDEALSVTRAASKILAEARPA